MQLRWVFLVADKIISPVCNHGSSREKEEQRRDVCVCALVWVGRLLSDVVQQHISHDHFRSPLHEHIPALKPSLT